MQAQLRFIKKKELEAVLSTLSKARGQKPSLEQYITPADIAADILFFSFCMGDISDKVVADLGCGTGIFAIGAALLGAKQAIGVDVDDGMVAIAQNNAKKLNLNNVRFVTKNVAEFSDSVDTVIQNPPFGAQKRHADRLFLDRAALLANTIYSLHLCRTLGFVKSYLGGKNFKITHEKSYMFPIPYTFTFHKKEKKTFEVCMIRAVRTI